MVFGPIKILAFTKKTATRSWPVTSAHLICPPARASSCRSAGKLAISKHYAAPGLDIYVGDIFALTRDTLGPVAATYDRAALVALPESMRADYAAHLADMTAGAPQLLITFAYDQSEMDGPPFAIPASLVQTLYGAAYQITPLEEIHFKGLLRGEVEATEAVYLLA